jgi:hypothetical protein
MKQLYQFLLVAFFVFFIIAGVGAVMLPPDPFSTLPVSIVSLVVCWPIAYWFTYRRNSRPT